MTIPQALALAIDHHKNGRLQDAEKLYRAILQTDPRHVDANHNLGVLAVSENQADAGLPHLKAAVEAVPSQGQYWLSYIDALIKAGRADSALKVIAQGRNMGLAGEAVDQLETLAGQSASEQSELPAAPSQPTLDFSSMITLREAGKYQDALDWLDLRLEAQPDDAEACAHRAHILLQLRREAEAREAVHQAQNLNAKLPVVQRNLARVLLTQKKQPML